MPGPGRAMMPMSCPIAPLLPAALVAGNASFRRLHPFIPPLVALAAMGVWLIGTGISAGTVGPMPLWFTLIMLSVVFVIIAAAAATPLPILGRSASVHAKATAFLLSLAASGQFLIALFVNPEQWPGAPSPLLADRLPLIVGWLFDGVMSIVPLSEIFGFDRAFSALLALGFYLELVIVAAAICGIVRLIMAAGPELVPAWRA